MRLKLRRRELPPAPPEFVYAEKQADGGWVLESGYMPENGQRFSTDELFATFAPLADLPLDYAAEPGKPELEGEDDDDFELESDESPSPPRKKAPTKPAAPRRGK